MWLSSWATTPSSSTRFIFSSRPVVTAMAAWFGLRPVANALGAGSSMTYTPGFGSPPAMHSPSTRLWSRWYSSGGAGRARLTASAILSARQYDVNATTPLSTSATSVNTIPLPTTAPIAAPTSATNTMNPTTSSTLRRLFDLISSNISGRSELDRRSGAGLVLGLEVLLGFEIEHLRDDHRRERLELVVVGQDTVVVELAGVGDPPLGGGQLFLQCQEVLVGLEVGIGLAEREQLTQRPRQHVVG